MNVTAQEWEVVASRTFLANPSGGYSVSEIKRAFPGHTLDEIAEGEFAMLRARGGSVNDLYTHGSTDWAVTVLLGGKVSLLQARLAAYQQPVPGLPGGLRGQALLIAAERREAEDRGKTVDQDRTDAANSRTDPTPPTPPARPPASQPPPVGGGQQGRQIDIDFSKAEVVPIPAGATSVLFKGEIILPPTLPGGIKPLIKMALGPRDGERVNAGLFKVTGKDTWGLEWDPDETRPLGGGKAKSGDITFEWTPGQVSVRIGARSAARVNKTVANQAAAGSVIVFGVDPPKPGSDKPAEYVRLLGGRLRGVLTFTGGATQPGPVDPPVDPLPPGGDLLGLAKNGLAAADAARNVFLVMINALEGRS